jgi:hypothetical protein
MTITNQPSNQNITYGTITGRFLLAYTDGPDGDTDLDWVACKGSVLFTPSPAFLKNSTLNVTFMPATVEAQLDAQGYINVKLLATDNQNNVPSDWTWQADFRLTDAEGIPTRGVDSFSFHVIGGTTEDLADIAQV